MRRSIGLVLAGAACAAAMLIGGWAMASPQHTTRTPAGFSWRQRPVTRVFDIRYGAEAQCDRVLCSRGGGEGTFLLPGRGMYRVVVTLSFQYQTTGDGRFRTGIGFFGPKVDPQYRPLAATTEPTSTTLVYVTHLKGGRYQPLAPRVNNVKPAGRTWSITMSQVVAVIQAQPVRTRT